MAPRSLNRREYGEFKRMLEQALLEIRLPAGIVDTDNIVPGSIRPENCAMSASWDFRGIVSADGNVLSGGSSNLSKTAQPVDQTNQRKVSVDNYSQSYTEPETPKENDVDEIVVFLDALRRKIIYTLPPVSKSFGKKVYVKRTDKDTSRICRILTYENDKLDDTDGLELGVGQAVVLIASSEQWHVFSLLS